ncbi:hypothetical protein OS493_020102 [Desmophyllum pertusum]|uniref:Helicase ATP-binding domain-containing protein n=1 Tax=Desmophyllum pertusum TaxID=174260 RepID=A0A9X0A087_9CNID|nr:hypothetical protein OS493_020102 [Desmophyllum pertusum]
MPGHENEVLLSKLAYTTTLMGVDGKNGAARSALLKISHQLSLIVIDECHMIFQRSGEFRKSFTELVGLHELFPNTPVMALTATLPAEQSEELITHYLKNPVVIKSTVNRPNIKLCVGEYDFKTEKKLPCSNKKKLAATVFEDTNEDECDEDGQGVNGTSKNARR